MIQFVAEQQRIGFRREVKQESLLMLQRLQSLCAYQVTLPVEENAQGKKVDIAIFEYSSVDRNRTIDKGIWSDWEEEG